MGKCAILGNETICSWECLYNEVQVPQLLSYYNQKSKENNCNSYLSYTETKEDNERMWLHHY